MDNSPQFTHPTRNHPFPVQFSINFLDPLGMLNEKHRPFTKHWRVALEQKVKQADSEHWPGALPRFESFVKKDGLSTLKKLTEKGANANFILLLFVQYMWVDDNKIPAHESDSPDKKGWEQMLDAIQITKRATAYFPTKFTDLVLNELSLRETSIRELFLTTKDFRKSKKRPPNDKVNRTIFTIYEHLKYKTGGPQWAHLLELLRAADAVSSPAGAASPDRRVKSHIRSFERDHPEEADFIKERLAKEDFPPWFIQNRFSSELNPSQPTPGK